MPTPASSQPTVVGMERLKPRAKKPIGLPHDVIMAEREGSDMEVDPIPVVPVDKGKRRADAGPTPKRTRRGTMAVPEVEGDSSKRDLQDLPSKPDPVAKRQRVIEASATGGLDFSGLQVREFDLVSEDQIAGAGTKVCCQKIQERVTS